MFRTAVLFMGDSKYKKMYKTFEQVAVKFEIIEMQESVKN